MCAHPFLFFNMGVNHELKMRKVYFYYVTENLRDEVLASYRKDTLHRGLSNEKVLRRLGKKRMLIDTIRNRQKTHTTGTYCLGNTTAESKGKTKRKKLF